MSELKQIKRHHERQLKNMDKKLTMYQIHPEDVSWLIERIEELEEILLQTNYDAALLEKRTEELLRINEQNKRYREAMKTALKVSEYYNAFGGDLEKVRADIHNILDKALEGEQ